MNEICCENCGKDVAISKVPRLYYIQKPLPDGEITILVVCKDCEPLFEKFYFQYCDACSKPIPIDDGATWYRVLRPLSTGGQEDISVCEECHPHFDDHIEFLYPTLGGPTYTDENRPPFWQNRAPLNYEGFHPSHSELDYVRLHDPERYADAIKKTALDTSQLPLDDFPLIEDFEIILQDCRMKHRPEEKEPDYTIHAFSPSLGYLASFYYMSCLAKDLCQADFSIPHGDFSIPYTDLEQAWNILLAENERFVYILTGNWENHEGYTTWFKVEKSRYYSEWEKAIRLCRSVSQEAQ